MQMQSATGLTEENSKTNLFYIIRIYQSEIYREVSHFLWLFGGAGRDGVGAGLVGALGGRHRVGVGIGSRNRKGMSEWLRLEVGGWRRCSLKTKCLKNDRIVTI